MGMGVALGVRMGGPLQCTHSPPSPTYVTVLPHAAQAGRHLGGQVVGVQVLLAAGQGGLGPQQLPPQALQLAVVGVEVGVDLQLTGAAHGQELAALPQTGVVVYTGKGIAQHITHMVNGLHLYIAF